MELACIILVMTIIVLFCVDAGVAFMAGSINDRACRDAARAAAQASSSSAAQSLAQAALNIYSSTNPFLGTPTISPQAFVYQDYSGNPPSDTSPYVSVTTTMTCRLPAPVIWGSTVGNGGTVTYTQTYQFPIVKTQLYLP